MWKFYNNDDENNTNDNNYGNEKRENVDQNGSLNSSGELKLPKINPTMPIDHIAHLRNSSKQYTSMIKAILYKTVAYK